LAGTIAPHREPGRIERSLEWRRAERAEVNTTQGPAAACAIADAHRQVEAIHERNGVKIRYINASAQLEVGNGNWRNRCCIAKQQPARATAIKTRIRAKNVKIAITAGPYTADAPVVRHSE